MQVTDAMVAAARKIIWGRDHNHLHGDDLISAALTAALAEMWRPVSEDSSGLLYFPEKATGSHRRVHLFEMMKVGRTADFPNRQPTHFMPLPPPPMGRG